MALPLTNVNSLNVVAHPDEGPFLDILKERYNVADKRLFKLEEELDVLLHCSKLLREERMELMQERIMYSDSLPSERTMERSSNQLVESYLALVQKSQGIEIAIQKLRIECTDARSECSWLFSRIRKIGAMAADAQQLKGKSPVVGNEGHAILGDFAHQDLWGYMDLETHWKRNVDTQNRVRDVAAIIGALGASVTYSTLFSATRGRLDIISWAFTSFALLLTHCVLVQSYEFPLHFRVFNMKHHTLTSRRIHHISRVMLPVTLMTAGFILLTLSILLSNPDVPPVARSRIAIQVAMYPPLLALGFSIATAIFYLIRSQVLEYGLFRARQRQTEAIDSHPHLPNHLVPQHQRWDMLPGGAEYALYRKRRAEARLGREGP